jgi:hypothetical protein
MARAPIIETERRNFRQSRIRLIWSGKDRRLLRLSFRLQLLDALFGLERIDRCRSSSLLAARDTAQANQPATQQG